MLRSGKSSMDTGATAIAPRMVANTDSQYANAEDDDELPTTACEDDVVMNMPEVGDDKRQWSSDDEDYIPSSDEDDDSFLDDLVAEDMLVDGIGGSFKANMSDDDDDATDKMMEDDEDENRRTCKKPNYAQFLFSRAVSDAEVAKVKDSVAKSLAGALEVVEKGGQQAFRDFLKKQREVSASTDNRKEEEKKALEDAAINGTPRDYQTALFEIAKRQNTIVNLGTGKGKTLIALLCIRHFADAFTEGKQTLFVVPSVPLAIQQTSTIQANLPYTIGTACLAVSHSDKARIALSKSNILVATHGAIHDLLMHYGDMFQMSRFNLVVFDECHYASGNHQYCAIMDKWYHPLPKEKRPRILGLTASPLINVKHSHSDEKLGQMLSSLETTLDATVASLKDLGVAGEGLLHKPAAEKHVFYQGTSVPPSFPSHEDRGLHEARIREFRQLDALYADIGPLAVGIYCQTLIREISCNVFEQESSKQFTVLIEHLQRIADFCEEECKKCPMNGRSQKLLQLERLLEEQIEFKGGRETVGLVFVERRITALALFNYFQHRQEAIEAKKWTRAAEMDAEHTEKQTVATSEVDKDVDGDSDDMSDLVPNNPIVPGQFDDSPSDPWGNQQLWDCPPPPTTAPFDDQFADPEDDLSIDMSGAVQEHHFETPLEPKPKIQIKGWREELGLLPPSADQFDDADSAPGDFKTGTSNAREPTVTIRTTVLVRQATQVFKYLNPGRKREAKKEEAKERSWLHQERRIRDILNSLRRGETNLLLATSVVEEGVDVQACSFVVVFDRLRSTKAYIQMKGRARQRDAKFFVFQDESQWKHSLLVNAQQAERRVHSFIATRKNEKLERVKPIAAVAAKETGSTDVLPAEIAAVEKGEYRTEHGFVDIRTAKSLLNKYALRIPLDPAARASRDSFLLHMPTFTDEQLILPAHLPPEVRVISLPPQYIDSTKAQRQQILALMACVRLHCLKLLNERLLPLSRSDLCERMLTSAAQEVPDVTTYMPNAGTLVDRDGKEYFVYPIVQNGKHMDVVREFGGLGSLALISTARLEVSVPSIDYVHGEFGEVGMQLGTEQAIRMTIAQWNLCMEFYRVLMNARWRRKSRKEWFYCRDKDSSSDIVAPYMVALLSSEGQLHWEGMRKIIDLSNRSEEERTSVGRKLASQDNPMPKICSPTYNLNVYYIVHGPSLLACDANFPEDEFGSFQDYYSEKWGFKVSKDCRLVTAQVFWALPVQPLQVAEGQNICVDEKQFETPEGAGEWRFIPGLRVVLLPIDACMEAQVSDVALSALLVLLPQFLYHVDQYLVAKSFVGHCVANLPRLGGVLEKLAPEEIIMAMSAKVADYGQNYEQLEWLGDAVLKLVQTDCLLQSPELKMWISCLHEGDLSTLRTAIGNNEFLCSACKHVAIDKFIFTIALARGKFVPHGLELRSSLDDSIAVSHENSPSMKVCADVIESLLGLVYLRAGYEASLSVARELGLILKRDTTQTQASHDKVNPRKGLSEICNRLTGKSVFKRPALLEEALTHPSAILEDVPSYQRLEFVGDAVLCLAVREWIYTNYPKLLVGDMVTVEGALVSNEMLGFQCVREGLHRFINHRDQSLPSRLEHYEWCINDDGRSVWGTDPSKILSDVVEALFGAVHVDGGFEEGQRAVIQLMSPILREVEKVNCDSKLLRHPKSALNELGGSYLRIETQREDVFTRNRSVASRVWQGARFREAIPEGIDLVGCVSAVGLDLVAVAERSRKSARNRACALVVAVLEEDEELASRLRKVSGLIQGDTCNQAKKE